MDTIFKYMIYKELERKLISNKMWNEKKYLVSASVSV